MSYAGNVTPADLDVDKMFEASRAMDETRAELRASRELAERLAGGVAVLERLEQAATILTRIQALHAALTDATADLERARLEVARVRLELTAEAWPRDPDAGPILARLTNAIPKLDRIDRVIGLLDGLEVTRYPR